MSMYAEENIYALCPTQLHKKGKDGKLTFILPVQPN